MIEFKKKIKEEEAKQMSSSAAKAQ